MIRRPEDPRQMELCCRADVVSEEPLVKVVDEVVRGLDLSALHARYLEGGRPYFDPAMQLKVLFFGYCDGVRSCRAIAKHIRFDVRYRYFCGSLRPDFRTINRFRKDHIDLLGDYFAQIVLHCRKAGLLDPSVLALDGTKIRAWGRKRSGKQQRAVLAEAFRARLQQDSATDGEGDDEGDDGQATDTDAGACSDPDARFMKTSEGGLRLSYNSQVVVDRNQLIVAADVSNRADDSVQFRGMIEQSERVLGAKPETVLADGGYYSGANLAYASEAGIDLYVPVSRTGRVPDDDFHRDRFVYEDTEDRYRCPAGQHVTYLRTRVRRGVSIREYRGSAATCGGCAFRSRCTTDRYRRVEISEHARHERAMQDKLAGSEGRRTYNLRKQLVEPVFGNIKFNLGFVRYRLRRLTNVRGEFLLICIAHNLKKLAAWWGLSRPSLASSVLSVLFLTLQALIPTLRRHVTCIRLLNPIPRLS